MEVAFDGPVFAFEFLEIITGNFLRVMAGDYVNAFVAHRAATQNTPLQGDDLTRGGKANLLGIGRLGGNRRAQLHAPTVEFPIRGRQRRFFTRGKKAALGAAFQCLGGGFSGCP